MTEKVGQEPFAAPNVFGWFLPGYVNSDSLAAKNGLVSPGSSMLTSPLTIGMLNGESSLIRFGLTGCDAGWGSYYTARCSSQSPSTIREQNSDGWYTFTPTEPGKPTAVVDELALVLTADRLDEKTRGIIVHEYTQVLAEQPVVLDSTAATASTVTRAITLALDGMTNNTDDWNQCFSTKGKTTDQFLQIELGSNRSVSSVVITLRAESASASKGYRVVLSDGTVCVESASVYNGMVVRHPCPENSGVTWVRVERPGYTKDPLQLCEVEVRERAFSAEGVYEPDELQHTDALTLATEMILGSPGFRVSNVAAPTAEKRDVKGAKPGKGRPHTNLVTIFFNGGMDSYSLVVPLDGCHTRNDTTGVETPFDLYAEYATVRENLAIAKSHLLPIDATGQGQPCNTFGINDELAFFHELYQEGELALIGNIGALYQPTTKEEYENNAKGARPKGLFACVAPSCSPAPAAGTSPTAASPRHNHMQKAAESVSVTQSAGVLGKILSQLDAEPTAMRTSLYGFRGLNHMMTGGPLPPTTIDPRTGVLRYKRIYEMGPRIAKMTDNTSTSFHGELYSETVQRAMKTSEELVRALSQRNPTAEAAAHPPHPRPLNWQRSALWGKNRRPATAASTPAKRRAKGCGRRARAA